MDIPTLDGLSMRDGWLGHAANRRFELFGRKRRCSVMALAVGGGGFLFPATSWT